jgi:hypothetical protein
MSYNPKAFGFLVITGRVVPFELLAQTALLSRARVSAVESGG